LKPLTPAGYSAAVGADKGSVVVVNFWASWCDPCLEELPAFFATVEKSKNVRFVLISLDGVKHAENAKRALFKAGVSARPNLRFFVAQMENGDDEMIDAVDRDWSGVLPATFVYDKAGKRRKRLDGGQNAKGFAAAISSAASVTPN
jgi:thiol-disulfide isomerase/thioredoxin